MEIDRFAWERALLKQGATLIAGVDEAGRGPLAGPVVAAAVMLPAAWVLDGLPSALHGLNDSKQLAVAQRQRFFGVLTACREVRWASGVVEAGVIDAINILRATHRAMAQALAQLHPAPQHVLVDGWRVATLAYPQTAVVRGDGQSYSIAAASVIAKVTRDRLMEEYDRHYPAYGFAQHKGYGTAQHIAALAQHGPCPQHRRSFAPLRPAEPDLFAR